MNTKRKRILMWYSNTLITLAIFLILTVLTGCTQSNTQSQSSQNTPPDKVYAITVYEQPFEVCSELPGRINPVRKAVVRARVAGIILSRNFIEGAYVKAGQVLYQIDPAPFKAALSKAQSDLARAEAELSNAQSIFKRNEPLVGIEAVSQQEFETLQATFKSAKAARQSAMAQVEMAELNLQYATVRAPISGQIGRSLITEGAFVGQSEATPLAIILQLDTVYVDFQQPIIEMLQLKDTFSSGQLTEDEGLIVP